MNFRNVFIAIIAALLFTSCSGGNETGITPNGKPELIEPLGILVSDYGSDGSAVAGYGVLGLFNLHLDMANELYELVPVRNSSLTDVLEIVDITNFLTMAPCTECVKIKSVAINLDGNLVVSIGIKHPFGVGDINKPITGQNRGDLHVFNIEGTIVSNATGTSFPGLGELTAGFSLVNADGFSGYLDDVLDAVYMTDATVHPYMLHFDDYSSGNFDASNPMGFASVTSPPPSGNLVMPMGCDYNYQDYVFDLSAGNVDFIYAVGCTYGVSSGSKSERFSPEYRVPQHNKKAASEVSVDIISNDLAEGNPVSTAELEVHVVDISHGVSVGANLDEMLSDSSVSAITIEVPGIETGPIIVDVSSPSGTGHDPTDPLTFPVTITNSAGAVEGVYAGMVKVLDSYIPGQNESPLLTGNDAIERVNPTENPLTGLFQISEFATYAVIEIPVLIVNDDPVADLIPTGAEVTMGNTIVWDATASSDLDGTIVQYEWDYDIPSGDPLNFSADATTSTPISTQVSDPYNTIGSFWAAVRVTDNLGGTDIAVVSFDVTEQIPDLVVDAVRNNYDPMSGWQPCVITHVNLDWEDMGGAVEYAAYRADLFSSPYNWTEIGTTTPPTSVFDDVNIGESQANWFDHSYIYEIRPRSIVGDPSSEGTPSQQGLVFMESNNAIPSPSHPNFTWRYGPISFNAQYAGSWCADETSAYGGIYVNITSWDTPAQSWQVYYPIQPIPDLDGQTNAYFDFAFTTGGWDRGPNFGFAPGTFTNPPASNGLSDFTDFDPASTSDHLLGMSYKSTFNSVAFETYFDEPSGTLAFHGAYYPWQATRYEIDRLLDADVDYPAIGMASWSTTGSGYHIWDSIAIVVY